MAHASPLVTATWTAHDPQDVICQSVAPASSARAEGVSLASAARCVSPAVASVPCASTGTTWLASCVPALVSHSRGPPSHSPFRTHRLPPWWPRLAATRTHLRNPGPTPTAAAGRAGSAGCDDASDDSVVHDPSDEPSATASGNGAGAGAASAAAGAGSGGPTAGATAGAADRGGHSSRVAEPPPLRTPAAVTVSTMTTEAEDEEGDGGGAAAADAARNGDRGGGDRGRLGVG